MFSQAVVDEVVKLCEEFKIEACEIIDVEMSSVEQEVSLNAIDKEPKKEPQNCQQQQMAPPAKKKRKKQKSKPDDIDNLLATMLPKKKEKPKPQAPKFDA